MGSLEFYRVFAQVARCGSLTRAARELGISQPAVSQALKQLEQQLGCRLFVRSSRGVQLTREGQELIGYVQAGLHTIQEGENRLRQMLNLDSGEITIGASDMTQEFFLLPYLERFHSRYPDLKVHMNNAPTPVILEQMRAHQIDLGVVSGPLSQLGQIEAVPVRQIQDVFVAGPAYHTYAGHPLKAAEIARLPLICLESNTSTRASFDRYMAAQKVDLQPEFELATSHMIVQFALRNLGIGCVVRDFAQPYLESGQLSELSLAVPMPPRSFYVISDPQKLMSAASLALRQMILGRDG